MTARRLPLAFASALALASPLGAQDLSPRLGLGVFVLQPSGAARTLYASGWMANLTLHVRREAEVEGRVRFEAGEFREGGDVPVVNGVVARYRARTRLVGYDWLIPLGAKRPTGPDLILGIGGVHWYRDRVERTLPSYPYPPGYAWTDWDTDVAFAGTVGLRYRISRQFEVEVHHVLTSQPKRDRDFSDAELNHTALGMTLRF